jgi:hypothetical protein
MVGYRGCIVVQCSSVAHTIATRDPDAFAFPAMPVEDFDGPPTKVAITSSAADALDLASGDSVVLRLGLMFVPQCIDEGCLHCRDASASQPETGVGALCPIVWCSSLEEVHTFVAMYVEQWQCRYDPSWGGVGRARCLAAISAMATRTDEECLSSGVAEVTVLDLSVGCDQVVKLVEDGPSGPRWILKIPRTEKDKVVAEVVCAALCDALPAQLRRCVHLPGVAYHTNDLLVQPYVGGTLLFELDAAVRAAFPDTLLRTAATAAVDEATHDAYLQRYRLAGQALAAIHACAVPIDVFPRGKHAPYVVEAKRGGPTFDSALGLSQFWDEVSDPHPLAANGVVTTTLAQRIHDCWLRERSRLLLAGSVAALPPVLNHGDFAASNLIATDDGGVAVIDWGDASYGPREQDLQCLFQEAFGTPRWEDFLRGYAEVAPQDAPLSPSLVEFYAVGRCMWTTGNSVAIADRRKRAILRGWLAKRLGPSESVSNADDARARGWVAFP